ncbi:hypothetical protein OROGR_004615 [Orobanche gracilis]
MSSSRGKRQASSPNDHSAWESENVYNYSIAETTQSEEDEDHSGWYDSALQKVSDDFSAWESGNVNNYSIAETAQYENYSINDLTSVIDGFHISDSDVYKPQPLPAEEQVFRQILAAVISNAAHSRSKFYYPAATQIGGGFQRQHKSAAASISEFDF